MTTVHETTDIEISERARVVDADAHVLEPPRALYELIEPKYRDRAPRLVERDGKEYWEGDLMVRNQSSDKSEEAQRRATGIGGMAGVKRWSDQERFDGGVKFDLNYTEANPGAFNPVERVRVFDEERIDQGVFFPTALLSVQSDPEYATALFRAYNEWLSDFCSHAPGRFFGACAAHLATPETAAAEVRRCAADPHFKAVFLRPNIYIEGTQWWDERYEQFWTACEDSDLPVVFHPLSSDGMRGAGRYFNIHDGSDHRASFLRAPFAHPVDAMFTLGSLISGGVLERHPRLRIGFVECSGGWVVPLLDRLDHRFDHLRQTVTAELTMKPSEYFERQCAIGFDPDEVSLIHGAQQLGADHVMVGSDFPHPDAFYPNFVGMVEDQMGPLTEPERRHVLGDTARVFYRLP